MIKGKLPKFRMVKPAHKAHVLIYDDDGSYSIIVREGKRQGSKIIFRDTGIISFKQALRRAIDWDGEENL